MIDISLDKNPELYSDYEKALSFLQGVPDAPIPGDPVNFHLYSEVKNRKEALAVRSFFATQNLDRCRLILWSDWDVRNNLLLAPLKDLIEFRVFNPLEEGRGTILEDSPNVLLATDRKHYMSSGLLRFLACHKYGGVWYDMDMVLLRDLSPVLDQEFSYMWGSETDFVNFGSCAAFMNIHKGSEHSNICMEELLKAPIRPDSVSRDHEMLAKVYKRRPFTVFPSAFFNTEWQINQKYAGLGTAIEKGWFSPTEHSGELFLEAFSWHWHNSASKDLPIRNDSKFDRIEKLTNERLHARGLSW